MRMRTRSHGSCESVAERRRRALFHELMDNNGAVLHERLKSTFRSFGIQAAGGLMVHREYGKLEGRFMSVARVPLTMLVSSVLAEVGPDARLPRGFWGYIKEWTGITRQRLDAWNSKSKTAVGARGPPAPDVPLAPRGRPTLLPRDVEEIMAVHVTISILQNQDMSAQRFELIVNSVINHVIATDPDNALVDRLISMCTQTAVAPDDTATTVVALRDGRPTDIPYDVDMPSSWYSYEPPSGFYNLWRSFSVRYGFSRVRARVTSLSRSAAQDDPVLRLQLQTLFARCVKHYKLKPNCIWSWDETRHRLLIKHLLTLTTKEIKEMRSWTRADGNVAASNDDCAVAALAMINAAGEKGPVSFKLTAGSDVVVAMSDGVQSLLETALRQAQNPWDLFFNSKSKKTPAFTAQEFRLTVLNFIKFLRATRPEYAAGREHHLVMLDNCSCHFPDELRDVAFQHNITFLFLPPNTTATLQVLDTCVFGPLKKALLQAVADVEIFKRHLNIKSLSVGALTTLVFRFLFNDIPPSRIVAGFADLKLHPDTCVALPDAEPPALSGGHAILHRDVVGMERGAPAEALAAVALASDADATEDQLREAVQRVDPKSAPGIFMLMNRLGAERTLFLFAKTTRQRRAAQLLASAVSAKSISARSKGTKALLFPSTAPALLDQLRARDMLSTLLDGALEDHKASASEFSSAVRALDKATTAASRAEAAADKAKQRVDELPAPAPDKQKIKALEMQLREARGSLKTALTDLKEARSAAEEVEKAKAQTTAAQAVQQTSRRPSRKRRAPERFRAGRKARADDKGVSAPMCVDDAEERVAHCQRTIEDLQEGIELARHSSGTPTQAHANAIKQNLARKAALEKAETEVADASASVDNARAACQGHMARALHLVRLAPALVDSQVTPGWVEEQKNAIECGENPHAAVRQLVIADLAAASGTSLASPTDDEDDVESEEPTDDEVHQFATTGGCTPRQLVGVVITQGRVGMHGGADVTDDHVAAFHTIQNTLICRAPVGFRESTAPGGAATANTTPPVDDEDDEGIEPDVEESE